MSFTKTKDRIWVAYDIFAAWLARRSMPVRKIGYGIFGAVLWIAYRLPNSKVRATFEALARHVGRDDTTRLFRDYVRGFLLGINRIEQVRHGHTDAIDAMFDFPEKARLDALLEKGGVVLAIPHTHASLAMGRGLARHYPVLALVRATQNPRRAASEHEIYENLGSEFFEVRTANPTLVARKVLKALKDGRIVIGTVDRIRNAPPEDAPVEVAGDLVRARAFDQPIGIAGWPARFAAKAGVPIIPVTVTQTPEKISLVLGREITPTEDPVETTQAWVSALEELLRAHPDEWIFSLDRHWSEVLRGLKERRD
ncbi:MAG: hypothetical protein LJE62_08095 [Silicimonas sp.]|nr:hypothetical protein [Silicimonas sp.]